MRIGEIEEDKSALNSDPKIVTAIIEEFTIEFMQGREITQMNFSYL